VRFRFGLFLSALIILVFQSCKEKEGKALTEGEIHYKIEYTGNVGVPKELLPQTLIFSFKKDKTLFEMTGMGNSGIANLTNPENDIYDSYFSLFVNKYYYVREPGEQFPGLESMENITVRKTSKRSVICGYNCMNAEVILPSDNGIIREIWYTNEIKAEDPNVSTPFSQIDGVLMGFFFIMGPAELRFNAENVYNKQIPEDVFLRRENFVRVTKESINKFISKMISI
jgi:hypothetical protein